MTDGRIIVGVDLHSQSLAAVDLAMTEARLHGLSVHLVHTDPWANHPAFRDLPPPPPDAVDLPGPHQAIRDARRRAEAHPGAVQVTSEIMVGSPVATLLAAAESAAMLVIGHRGAGGFPGLALGSVARALAEHAHCPVLVTRGEAGSTGTAVLLGVDGSAANEPAIEFAFAEAAAREAELVAVHAWTQALLPGLRGGHHRAEAEAAERGRLTAALAPPSSRHPGVRVREVLATGPPARALVHATEEAQLVVVGARGGGGILGLRLGSVSHALLHHSHCPVAVIHHPAR